MNIAMTTSTPGNWNANATMDTFMSATLNATPDARVSRVAKTKRRAKWEGGEPLLQVRLYPG